MVEVVSDGGDLAQFEFGEAQTTPALSRADKRIERELEHRFLTEAIENDRGGVSRIIDLALDVERSLPSGAESCTAVERRLRRRLRAAPALGVIRRDWIGGGVGGTPPLQARR